MIALPELPDGRNAKRSVSDGAFELASEQWESQAALGSKTTFENCNMPDVLQRSPEISEMNVGYIKFHSSIYPTRVLDLIEDEIRD